MQSQSESFVRQGVVASFVDIARNEGVAGLWRVRFSSVDHGQFTGYFLL